MNVEAQQSHPVVDRRHLIAYGVGGDYIGARRARRAFRLLVIAVLVFTFSLYFVEKFLRYDLIEVQYRMSLTFEDDSQRAILRNVVRRDALRGTVPTARYVEALANIEEDDVVLERFAEAVKLAPDNGNLLMVYGCKLFQQLQYTESWQIFREANLKTSRNALPKYLQAAALVASSSSEEDFRTALALVGRANDAGEQAAFPQPLWHESLPKAGHWYDTLRRRLADQCCAPLYHFKNLVIRRAQEQAGEGDFQEWDAWLNQLQQMGDRLLGNEDSERENLGTSQAICGLQIQKDALAMRISLREKAGLPPDSALIERQVKVQEAMGVAQRFEVEREQFANAARIQVQRPLRNVATGLFALFAASAFYWLVAALFHTDRNSRARRQTRREFVALLIWGSLLFLILAGISAGWGGAPAVSAVLSGAWFLLLGLALLVAPIYPALILPSPGSVCAGLTAEPSYSERLAEARACRRRAYLSAAGQFAGRALGVFLISTCLWFVGYRIVAGLYPTDTKLILPGMEAGEMAVIETIRQMLLVV